MRISDVTLPLSLKFILVHMLDSYTYVVCGAPDQILPCLLCSNLLFCSGTFALIALTSGETVEVFTTRAEFLQKCTRNATLVTEDMISCDDFSVRTALTLSLSAGVFLVSGPEGEGKGARIGGSEGEGR